MQNNLLRLAMRLMLNVRNNMANYLAMQRTEAAPNAMPAGPSATTSPSTETVAAVEKASKLRVAIAS
jgi:hypothetical protein